MAQEQVHSQPEDVLIRSLLACFPSSSVNVFDRDLRCLFTEGTGLKGAGLDAASLAGRRLEDVLHADQFARVNPQFSRAFAGEAVVFDLSLGGHTYEVRATPCAINGGGVATIVVVAKNVTAARAEAAQRHLLRDVGDAMASSLDVEATLAAVTRLLVPRLGDWWVVHLIGEDGEIDRVALTHADPSKVMLTRELVEGYSFKREATSGIARVLRTGQSELIRRVTDVMLLAAAVVERQLARLRSVGLTSSMIVPMTTRSGAVGAITLAAVTPRPP